MATHELKIEPRYFQAILDRKKRFEIRREDDKTFAEGDVLVLREVIPPGVPYAGVIVGEGWTFFSGRMVQVIVTDEPLRGAPYVPDGYAVLGIQVIATKPPEDEDFEINVEYSVRCEECLGTVGGYHYSQDEAIEEAKELGARVIDGKGWCADCLATREEAAE